MDGTPSISESLSKICGAQSRIPRSSFGSRIPALDAALYRPACEQLELWVELATMYLGSGGLHGLHEAASLKVQSVDLRTAADEVHVTRRAVVVHVPAVPAR